MSCSATREQIMSDEWIDNLTICLCGKEVDNLDSLTHEGCIISGIARNLFTDRKGWIEYSKKNGRRIAPYYRSSR
jgi:hypothetical protein